MLTSKHYLKVLFTILVGIFLWAIAYIYDFTTKYPMPITNRISFDAKLKFMREKVNVNEIDTLIVGSSIGLNNILGATLEKYSSKVTHALNLSVYEATTLQVEQILELSDAFPHLKRIIYSAQYSDFPHARRYKNYDSSLLKKYIRHELSFLQYIKLVFHSCNNLLFCKQRKEKWDSKHQQSDKFTSLLFDHTGSVPLEIYKKKGVGGRWYLPHPGIMHDESFKAVSRMAQKYEKKGIKYYLVHQPYREELVKKHQSVRNALKYFDDKIEPIMNKYNGELISLQYLHLNNDYHADRTHLNTRGSTKVSQEIAKKIDNIEK